MQRRDSHSNTNSEINWMKKNNVQTTKVFTPNFSDSNSYYKINKESIIPAIQEIANQNTFLKQQGNSISNQIKKLATLGQYLVAENARLRLHYLQRNQDVQNMIQTMQVNLTMETNDIQHQIHLLKQSNCITFKNVQNCKSTIQEHQDRIAAINAMLLQLKEQNTVNRDKVLNPLKVRLQNKLNSEFIEKLERQVSELNFKEDRLIEEVLDLTMETTSLREKNSNKGRQASQEQYENKNDKDQCKQDIVHALKTLTQLKEECQGLEHACQKQEQLNQDLHDKSQKMMMKFRELVGSREKKTSLLSKARFERQKQVQAIHDNKKRSAQLQVERMKRNEEKEKIQDAIKAKKKKIEENLNRQKGQKEAFENQHMAKITEFRKNIDKIQEEGEADRKKIKADFNSMNHSCELLREEHSALEADYENYEQMVRKLENPIQEIERAQLLLRLQGNRALRSISSNF